MPSIADENEVKVGDEWIRYHEMELKDEELELCVDHFWHRNFSKCDECGDNFKALPKMVKCALVLCHSNADVESSLSINKKMLTTQNFGMKGETITGLRVIKAAVTECGGEHSAQISLDMVKVADKSYRLYNEQ